LHPPSPLTHVVYGLVTLWRRFLCLLSLRISLSFPPPPPHYFRSFPSLHGLQDSFSAMVKLFFPPPFSENPNTPFLMPWQPFGTATPSCFGFLPPPHFFFFLAAFAICSFLDLMLSLALQLLSPFLCRCFCRHSASPGAVVPFPNLHALSPLFCLFCLERTRFLMPFCFLSRFQVFLIELPHNTALHCWYRLSSFLPVRRSPSLHAVRVS